MADTQVETALEIKLTDGRVAILRSIQELRSLDLSMIEQVHVIHITKKELDMNDLILVSEGKETSFPHLAPKNLQ